MKALSFQTSLILLLSFCSQSAFAQQGEKAEDFRKKAVSFSESFQYDSAMTYHQLAKEAFLKEGDTTMYYMSDVDIAFELLRKGLLKESQQMVEQAYAKGKPFMGDVDKGLVFRAIAHAINLQGDQETSLAYYDSVVMMLEKDTSFLAKRTLAIVSSDKGIMHYGLSDYKQAENYWKESLGMLVELPPEKVAKTICEVSMNASVVMQFRGGYFEANEILQRAHEVALEHLPENHNMLSFILQSMARGFSFQGYYDKSIEYYRYLTQAFDQLGDSPNKILTSYEVSIIYANTSRPKEALKYVNNGLELTESLFGKNDQRIAIGYDLKGDIGWAIGDNEAALENYEKAVSIEQQNGRGKSMYAASGLTGLGLAYRSMGQYEKSTMYFRQAIKIIRQNGESANYYLSKNQLHMGKNFLATQEPDSAMVYFQKSLVNNAYEFDPSVFSDYPGEDAIITNLTGYDAILGKCLAFELYYDQTSDQTYLKHALHALQLGKVVSQSLKKDSNVLEDKLRIQKNVSSLSIPGTRLHYKAYEHYGEPQYLDSMLAYMELGKSELILRNLQNARTLEDANKSHLIERYEELERGISHHKEQLYYAEESQDSAQIAIQTRNLFQLRSKQDTLMQSMEQNQDMYLMSRFGNQSNILDEIQAILDEDQLLLNYMVGDTALYIMAISKDDVKVYTESPEGLEEQAGSLLDQLAHPKYGKAAVDHFQEAANDLYTKLIPKELSLDEYEDLIIIPDKYLYQLPFEVLVTQTSDQPEAFDELPYLLMEKQVLYANSSSLLINQSSSKPSSASQGILAFAPVFDSLEVESMNQVDTTRQGFGALAWTQKEVENLSNYYTTNALLGMEATERRLRELKSEYAILHVASHGILNADNPLYSRLLFSPNETDSVNDGSLSTMELFAMDIPAEMVVLSACNSGTGLLASGEGIISLANGFFYAGSKSLVMSLWTANDQSTATIVGDFYAQLAKGQSKSEALRNTKLNFLANADGIRSHPYFWAHLVVNGNNRPIKAQSNWSVYLLLIVMLSGLLVVALKRKLAKK